MKSINIDKMIYLILLLSLVGCKNVHVSENTQDIITEKLKIRTPLDSLALINILYSKKEIIPSHTNDKPFTLSTTSNNEMINFSANSTIKDLKVRYELHVKSSLRIEEFKWYNEDLYENIKASFTINETIIDVSESKLLNSNRTIYPAGLWHWSVEDVGSIKIAEYKNKTYILLNGPDLLCNGSQCSSYQLYALVYDKVTKQVKFNAILTDGLYPYQFSSLHLFKPEGADKLPQFYILKEGITEISGIEDFNVYGFNENGDIYKN